jgi:adenine/guanine phosphoribosyltransferase-like PRPP-binding protein
MTNYNGGKGLIVSQGSDNPFCDEHFDFRQTLINCQGLYECPTDDQGRPQGPLVGYAGKYDSGDGVMANYVGLPYYNFSMADQHPAVLRRVAIELANLFLAGGHETDVILGAPMAGIKISAALAEELGCRHIFAEKEVVALGANGGRADERLAMKRYDIPAGARVWVGEELINNLSTALELVNLIKSVGARFCGIIAVINRSADDIRTFYGMPIVSLLHVPTPQYRQDDPLVVDALRRGYEIIWKPKPSWAMLKAAMGDSK